MPRDSEAAEQRPLLERVDDEHYGSLQDETETTGSSSNPTQRDAGYLSASSRHVLQLCLLMFIFNLIQYASYAPLTAVFEDIICTHYYASHPQHLSVPGKDCKIAPVQHELAIVTGYKDSFGQIPNIAFGIPLGLLADRIGRRPVILLFLLGMFFYDTWIKAVCVFSAHLPLRLVWLAPIFKAVGGGANFGMSMLFTAAADVTSENERVNAFMRLSAMEMVVQIIGAPLMSTLMVANKWYPLILSSILLLLAGAIAGFLPETHPRFRKITGAPVSIEEQSSNPKGSNNNGNNGNNSDDPMSEPYFTLVQKLVTRSFTAFGGYLKDAGICLSLIVFVLAAWGEHSTALLVQYVAQKFKWEFETANLLSLLRGSITLLLSLVIIKAIDSFIQRQLGIKSAQKDLLLSTGSCILLIIGVGLVGLAQTQGAMLTGVVISALGSSLLVSFRCAMVSLFSTTPVASLNAVAGIAQSVGILISGPVLAAAYGWGLSQGGVWTGSPFLLGSALHVIALAVILYLSRTKASVQTLTPTESEEP